MDRITALRARRAGVIEQMEALVASVGEDEDMTAEQVAQFDALKADDDRLAGQIAQAEDLERRRAAAARVSAPLPGVTAATAAGAPVPARPAEKGLTFARMARTLFAAGGNAYVAMQLAEANGDSGLFASQNMGSGPAGGFLVPEDVSEEIIELLRPASVVRAMGPRIVPMPNGNLTMNRHAAGVMSGYIGEQQNIPVSALEFGQLKLSAKKLGVIVPMSGDWLRSTGVAGDRIVRDDIVMEAATTESQYFLRGSGTEHSPKGLRFQHTGTAFASTHVLSMTATPDLQKVTNDLGRLELALANSNLPYAGAHWVGAPRTAMFLTNLKDGNGNAAFPEMAGGMLRGKPFHQTTQIPINLGGGTESELMLVHPAHVVIGEHMGIDLSVSTEAAYADGTGTLKAAFSRDETLLRMIMQHDIGLKHLSAVSILTGVTWGA